MEKREMIIKRGGEVGVCVCGEEPSWQAISHFFFFPLLILNKAVCKFEPRETFIKIN